MNYSVYLVGLDADLTTICSKLLIQTAQSADYIVETEGFSILSNTVYTAYKINLSYGKRKETSTILLDFDSSNLKIDYHLSLNHTILNINKDNRKNYYWIIFSCIFRIINDLSPAYATGYLLDNKLESAVREINQFNFSMAAGLTLQLGNITDKA